MKKLISVSILLLTLAGTAFATTVIWPDFPDVEEGSYYEHGVNVMRDLGVMSGYENGNFGPNDSVTRGQLATTLNNYDQKVIDELKQENAYLKTLVCTQFGEEDSSYNDYQTSWEEICAPKMSAE